MCPEFRDLPIFQVSKDRPGLSFGKLSGGNTEQLEPEVIKETNISKIMINHFQNLDSVKIETQSENVFIWLQTKYLFCSVCLL